MSPIARTHTLMAPGCCTAGGSGPTDGSADMREER